MPAFSMLQLDEESTRGSRRAGEHAEEPSSSSSDATGQRVATHASSDGLLQSQAGTGRQRFRSIRGRASSRAGARADVGAGAVAGTGSGTKEGAHSHSHTKFIGGLVQQGLEVAKGVAAHVVSHVASHLASKSAAQFLNSPVQGATTEPAERPPPMPRALLPEEIAALQGQGGTIDKMTQLLASEGGGSGDGDANGGDAEEAQRSKSTLRHEAFRVFGDLDAPAADTEMSPPMPVKPAPATEEGADAGGARKPPMPVMPIAVPADAGKEGRPAVAEALGHLNQGRATGEYANMRFSARDMAGGPFASLGDREYRFVREDEKGEFQQQLDENNRLMFPDGDSTQGSSGAE